jgi:hypothetical protein
MFAKTFIVSLFATASLFAQSAVVRGEIVDGHLTGTGCYYCPGSQFTLKFVGIRLESATINLAQFEVSGTKVELTGNWDGTIFHVSNAAIIPEMFSITGNSTLGSRVRWDAHGNAGDLAVNAASLGTHFMIPITNMATLLDPATTVVLGIGMTSGTGEFRTDVNIPQNPALVGLRINGQAVFAPPSGPLYASNLDTTLVQ